MVSNRQNNINNNSVGNGRGLPVYVYLKFSYQIITHNIVLFRNSSMQQMVQQIREKINEKFGIEEHEYELVECGQTTPQGVPSEEAPALIIEERTIGERFNDQNNIAFYIRLIPPTEFAEVLTRFEQIPSASASASALEEDPPICVICQETNPTLTTYFGCSHPVCDDCCSGCIQADIEHCAICRHYRIIS